MTVEMLSSKKCVGSSLRPKSSTGGDGEISLTVHISLCHPGRREAATRDPVAKDTACGPWIPGLRRCHSRESGNSRGSARDDNNTEFLITTLAGVRASNGGRRVIGFADPKAAV